MRNVSNTVRHMTEANGYHLGDWIDSSNPLPAVDAKGVCSVHRGEVVGIQKQGESLFFLIQDKGTPGNFRDKTARYQVGGPLFDSLYPVECEDLPVLA